MPTTTNYGWTTPADTDLVKDGASAIRTLGNSIDSTLKTQIDAQIPDSIVDAKGDLITATADNTPARLAVGTNGQVLTADSTTATGLKWATATSGGMTQLATGSLSSGSSVTISSISGSYKDLRLVTSGLKITGYNYPQLYLRPNNNTGTVYKQYYAVGGDNNNNSFDQTEWSIGFFSPASNGYASSVCDIYDYANSSTWKLGSFQSCSEGSTAGKYYAFATYGTNIFGSTAAITSLTLVAGGYTFAGGTYTLYGVS